MGLPGDIPWRVTSRWRSSDRVGGIIVLFASTMVLAAAATGVVAYIAVNRPDIEPLVATAEAVAAESVVTTDNFFTAAETAGSLVERVVDGAPLSTDDELAHMMQLVVAESAVVSGIFVGYGDGSFMYVTSGLATEPDGLRMKVIRNADLPDREVVEYQLDDTLSVVSTEVLDSDFYDPRSRVWYEGARQSEIGWTDPYVFASSGEPGITYYKRHESFSELGTVVGVDMRLTEVTDFLSARQPGANGVAAVISPSGAVITGGNVPDDAMLDPKLLDVRVSDAVRTVVSDMPTSDERRVAVYSAVGAGDGWTMVVAATESDYAARLSGQFGRIRRVIPLIAATFVVLVLLLSSAALSRLGRLRRKAMVDSESGLATRTEAHAVLEYRLTGTEPLLVAVASIGRDDAVSETRFTAAIVHDLGMALRDFVGADGVAGRTGSREFLVARALDPHESAGALANSLHQSLRDVVRRDSNGNPSPAIGWTVIPGSGRAIAAVLRDVDLALLAAEAGSRPVVEYSDEMQPSVVADERRRRELSEAIESEAFETYFQPEIDLRTGELVGAEALLRRNLVDGRVEDATHFIADLERLGLLPLLTHSVIDQVSDFALRWQAHASFTIRLNLAAIELNDATVTARLSRLTALTEHRWCVELTERTIESLNQDAVGALQDLASAGVGIALDDFGTGYSSMAELKRLPITALKIDRTFVEPLAIGPLEPVSIAALIQDVASRLGLDLVAEGVETEQQRGALVNLGCVRGQGWLVSPALGSNDFVLWAQQRSLVSNQFGDAAGLGTAAAERD